MKIKTIHALIVLTLISLVLIFYRFNQVPSHLAFDEVEFAKIALSLDGRLYTPYSPLAYGHSTLYFYVLLVSMKLFGVTMLGLRLPAALFGVANILLFYFILKKVIKNDLASLVGAVLLATQRWYFNFAKFSFEATFLLFLELVSINYLISFFRNKSTKNLVISAIFAGLAFHSYYPGRIFFVIPLLFIFFKIGKKYALQFLSIFLIVIAPLLIYFSNHPDTRVDQLFFLSSNKMTAQAKVNELGENIKRNTLMFYKTGDMNGRHNYPGKAALNPIVALLFTGGLILAVRNRKEWSKQLFLGYFFIGILPPILTYAHENPNMLRSFTVLPSVTFFCALFIQFLMKKVKIISSARGIFILAVILYLSMLYDARTYFVYQADVSRYAFEVTCDLDKVLHMQPTTLGDIPQICRM